jgi:uncharacterized protein YecT (DUF1311 family)
MSRFAVLVVVLPLLVYASEETNCYPGTSVADGTCIAYEGEKPNCDPANGVVSELCDCSQAKNELERSFCFAGKRDETDKRLNEIYATLRERLPAEEKKLLRDAQCAWLRFRRAECLLHVGPSPGIGSGWNSHFAICEREAAERRIEELQKHYACSYGNCSN